MYLTDSQFQALKALLQEHNLLGEFNVIINTHKPIPTLSYDDGECNACLCKNCIFGTCVDNCTVTETVNCRPEMCVEECEQYKRGDN